MPCKTKEAQAKSARKHYEANKEKLKKRARLFSDEARKRNREYVKDYLENHPCIDCGESDIIVLEFDHVRGKKSNNVADGVFNGWSIEKLQNEIDKCDVRCANCHRRITHKRKYMRGNVMVAGEAHNLSVQFDSGDRN
jgi:hypothetical protein